MARPDWFTTTSSLGLVLLTGLVAVGLGQAMWGEPLAGAPAPEPPESGVAVSPGVLDEDTDVALRQDGRPAAGRWRVVRDAMRMTEEQRAMAAELEAIGYADGTREVDHGTQVVPVHDPDRAWQGVNLYHAGHEPSVYLMSMEGETLFQWKTTYTDVFGREPQRPGFPGTTHPRRVELGEGGEIYWVFEGRGVGRTNVDGSVAWGRLSGAHHDVELAPDGLIAVLERDSALHNGLDSRRPALIDEISFRDRRTGREVRSVSLVDALLDAGFGKILTVQAGDVLHTNSLRRITAEVAEGVDHPGFVEGHYLVSMRTPSAIGVVDPDRRVFTWVHKGDYRAQHEAVVNADGELALFDNLGAGKRRSRALVHDLRTMRRTWKWLGPSRKDRLWSKILSTVDFLPNGNLLVVEGEGARAFEVARPGGEVVWQMHSPHRAGPDDRFVAALFDVVRYRRDDPRIVAVLGPAD